jgi:hypothetical protein
MAGTSWSPRTFKIRLTVGAYRRVFAPLLMLSRKCFTCGKSEAPYSKKTVHVGKRKERAGNGLSVLITG